MGETQYKELLCYDRGVTLEMQRQLQGVPRLRESTQSKDNLEGGSPSPVWARTLLEKVWWQLISGEDHWAAQARVGQSGTTLPGEMSHRLVTLRENGGTMHA